ncbi:YALI0F28325p [Yarrowia lipolytica CLIB122]|uniref:YALI0F28325p n=1 Tax=Yarrowia lipolytica (strain CLIB 122 / E 150) TaxID=284591 RepID=Q6C027_YARLI|nr:YALI0F28325p [Yarrowia lipolytica CLIB122]KAJ8055127.1 hypothetical protein LXG23DRAFT_47186 [Yarrowia lipolytica]RMI99905.1 hypothetical protein BD777DRAFT_109598 [Yarrowia lipolytica]CAG78797.1 YALI0F28325p [Yarrowia lipolytica CLIB122]|eukprot:XP_505985.1 YALI0F28325p [Yarrowia lipolytica CLIB122]
MVAIKYSLAASILAASAMAAPALEERGGSDHGSWGGKGEVSKGGSWGGKGEVSKGGSWGGKGEVSKGGSWGGKGEVSKGGSWGGKGEVSKGGSWGGSKEETNSWGGQGSVAPVGPIIKTIQDCSVGISGAVSLVASLTLHGDISSTTTALAICSKAVEGLSQSVPALIAGIQGSIIFQQGGALAQLCAPGLSTIVNLTIQVVSSLIGVIGKLISKSCSDEQITQIATLLHTCKGLIVDLNGCLGGIVSGGIDFGHGKLTQDLLPKIDGAVNSCQSCQTKKVCNGW